MAKFNSDPETVDASQQEIIIERREEIGRVQLSWNGTVDPIAASFEVAAHYLAENASGVCTVPIRIEFKIGDCTFIAGVNI